MICTKIMKDSKQRKATKQKTVIHIKKNQLKDRGIRDLSLA